jgi:hypothetical protein
MQTGLPEQSASLPSDLEGEFRNFEEISSHSDAAFYYPPLAAAYTLGRLSVLSHRPAVFTDLERRFHHLGELPGAGLAGRSRDRRLPR